MSLIPAGMAEDAIASVYARWCATTPRARFPNTLDALAAKLETSTAHLMALHNSPWWPDFVNHLCGNWTPGFSTAITDNVLEALAEKAQKGDVSAIKLYLEMAGIYTPRGPGRAAKAMEAEEDLTKRGDDELERIAGELGIGGT